MIIADERDFVRLCEKCYEKAGEVNQNVLITAPTRCEICFRNYKRKYADKKKGEYTYEEKQLDDLAELAKNAKKSVKELTNI